MKKILVITISSFLFINTVNAVDIESELTNLKNQYDNLNEKVNKIDEKILNKAYPIGSVYITTTYSTAAEVAEAIGGTWERYSNGKTLVGVDEDDADFNAINKTGGASSITLSTSNLPSHTHSVPSLTGSTNGTGSHKHDIPQLSGSAASAGAHTHTRGTMDITGYLGGHGNYEPKFGTPGGAFYARGTVNYYSQTTNGSGYTRYDGFNFQASRSWTGSTSSNGAHTHSVKTNASQTKDAGNHSHTFTTTASNTKNTGSGSSFTNLQPYITVYMYKRIA